MSAGHPDLWRPETVETKEIAMKSLSGLAAHSPKIVITDLITFIQSITAKKPP